MNKENSENKQSETKSTENKDEKTFSSASDGSNNDDSNHAVSVENDDYEKAFQYISKISPSTENIPAALKVALKKVNKCRCTLNVEHAAIRLKLEEASKRSKIVTTRLYNLKNSVSGVVYSLKSTNVVPDIDIYRAGVNKLLKEHDGIVERMKEISDRQKVIDEHKKNLEELTKSFQEKLDLLKENFVNEE